MCLPSALLAVTCDSVCPCQSSATECVFVFAYIQCDEDLRDGLSRGLAHLVPLRLVSNLERLPLLDETRLVSHLVTTPVSEPVVLGSVLWLSKLVCGWTLVQAASGDRCVALGAGRITANGGLTVPTGQSLTVEGTGTLSVAGAPCLRDGCFSTHYCRFAQFLRVFC